MQHGRSLVALLQCLLDVAVSCGLLYGLAVHRTGSFELSGSYQLLILAAGVLVAAIYTSTGVHRPVSRIARVVRLFKSWFAVVGALLFVGFLTQTSEYFSRQVLLLWMCFAPAAQLVDDIVVRPFLVRAVGRQGRVHSILVGGGAHGARLAASIRRECGSDEELLGFVAPNDVKAPTDPETPLLGTLDALEELVPRLEIRRVYLALPLDQTELLRPLFQKLLMHHVDVVWAPEIFDAQFLNHGVDDIGGSPVVYLSSQPIVGTGALLKDGLDRTGAALGLLLLAPLLLVIAGAIRATSGGPAIFRQIRRGWDGRPFVVYKFRTMYQHEEPAGSVTQACRGDHRVTPVGRLLRRTSMDELPQLLNVLRGEMSLVGPRPHALEHDDLYGARIERYMLRQRIKPGMTGLAQVNGCRGETQTLEQMEARVQLDLLYLNNWSLWLDLKILLVTFLVLPFQRSAY